MQEGVINFNVLKHIMSSIHLLVLTVRYTSPMKNYSAACFELRQHFELSGEHPSPTIYVSSQTGLDRSENWTSDVATSTESRHGSSMESENPTDKVFTG